MRPNGSALVLLANLQPGVSPSCNYTGGFANRAPGPCSGDVPKACDGALDGYANTRCCPSGSRCDISSGNAYCCPDEEDCASRVAAAPKCAGTGSSLWHFGNTLATDSWCCDSVHFGVAVFDSRGSFVAAACAPSGRPLAPVTAGYFQTSATQPPSICAGNKTATASATATATSTPSASGTGSAANQEHPAALGTGGIAGIVVGCVAGVVSVGVASWFVLLHRRTKQGLGQTGSSSSPYSPVELRSAEYKGAGMQWEDSAYGPSRPPVAELGTPRQGPVHELGT